MDGSGAPLSGMSALDRFERIGSWSVPGFRRRQCGVVSHDRNGTELRVVCIPEEGEDVEYHTGGAGRRAATIRGIVETGEHVVLDECVERRAVMVPITFPGERWQGGFIQHPSPPPGEECEQAGAGGGAAAEEESPSIMIKSWYAARRMYASEAPIPDRPEFSSMWASFTSLYTWLDDCVIDADLEVHDAVTITFSPPKDRRVRVSDDLTLEIRHGYGMPLGGPEQARFMLPRRARVEFSASRERELEWLYYNAWKFAGFLMMATPHPVQPEALQGRAGGRRCGIFPGYATYGPAVDSGRRAMYFTYQQIKDGFEEAIAGWYGMYEKYGDSMDIYFRTRLEGGGLPAEARFLRIMQALEAFYRAGHPGEEPGMEEMLAAVAGESGGIIEGDRWEGKFASEAADSCHVLSRGILQKRMRGIPWGHDLLRTTERAEVLAYGCYLGRMALDEEIKRGIVGRKREEASDLHYR